MEATHFNVDSVHTRRTYPMRPTPLSKNIPGPEGPVLLTGRKSPRVPIIPERGCRGHLNSGKFHDGNQVPEPGKSG